MKQNLSELSEHELAAMIEKAEKVLKEKQSKTRREGIAKIKELAASIGVSVEISESGKPPRSRTGGKVAIKYRNPENPDHQWTGRGMKPKWLRELLEQGRSLDEFAL